LRGGAQQRLVGNAAPQEEREARREFDAAHRMHRAGHRAHGVALDTEREARAGQDALQAALDAGLEGATAAGGVVELENRRQLHGADRLTVSAAREPAENLLRARTLGR